MINNCKRTGKLRKKVSLSYRLIKAAVRIAYPETEVIGQENLPQGPAIVAGNHSQAHGPIACELYFPGMHDIWCIADMMDRKTVPAYAYQDFWSGKPKRVRWLYKLASYLIAPLSECVFNNANTIPVYKDKRVVETLRKTVDRLQKGSRVVIFPEEYEEHNTIVHHFQQGFVDTARHYYRKTGEDIPFVPLYVCPALRKLVIGKPIYYDHTADSREERERICAYLMDEISRMAYELPRHRVVPYPNVSKKEYPENIKEQ